MAVVNHEELAKNFKYLLLVILVVIALNVLSFIISKQAPQLALPFIGVALLVQIALLVAVFKTTTSLGWGIASQIAVLVCMFIPCVNLILLLVINSAAVKTLKAAGYKVGLMGATRG